MATGPLRLFLSYAHEDRDLAVELRNHLAPLRYEQVVNDWYDRDLMAGSDWDAEIRRQLDCASLVLALVSSDYLSSSYGYHHELTRALELHDRGLLRVVPLIVRSCSWQSLPLARLHVLPDDGRAVNSWSNRDDAWVNVVSGIESTARDMLASGNNTVDDWLTSRLLRRKVIKHVQQELARRGIYAGPVDGIPGPATESALVTFQKHTGLTVDARIGPEVLVHLRPTNRD